MPRRRAVSCCETSETRLDRLLLMWVILFELDTIIFILMCIIVHFEAFRSKLGYELLFRAFVETKKSLSWITCANDYGLC